MKHFNQLKKFRSLAFFLSLTLVLGCTSSSGVTSGTTDTGTDTGTETETSTLSLTGTVSVPVYGAASVNAVPSALVKTKSATAIEYGQTSALVSIIIIHALTAVGESSAKKFQSMATPVDPVETDSAGAFEFALDPEDVAEGDMIVVTTDAGVSTAYVVEEADTAATAIELEEVDLDSTLAWESLKGTMEESYGAAFENWGDIADMSDVEFTFQPDCYLAMQKAQWSTAGSEETGMGANLAMMKNLIAAAGASSDGSFAMDEIANELLAGTLDTAEMATLADAAAENFGGNADVYVDSMANVLVDHAVIDGVFQETIAAVDAEEDLCGQMKADTAFLQETVGVMMNFDDVENFANTFGTEDGVGAYMTFMDGYKNDAGVYVFEDTALGWDPMACAGIFQAVGTAGTFENFATNVADYHDIMMNIPPPATAGEDFDYGDWGAAMTSHYMDAPLTFDSTEAAGYWFYQVDSGFNLDGEDTAVIDFSGAFTGAQAMGPAIDFSLCLTDPTACQAAIGDEDLGITGVTYYDPAAMAAGHCGDGACDEMEQYGACPLDCGGYTGAAGTAAIYTSTCGNAACEALEEFSCPADCTAGASPTGASPAPAVPGMM